MSVFYNSPVLATSGYLARAVVNNVLKGSIFRKANANGNGGGDANIGDYNCPVQ